MKKFQARQGDLLFEVVKVPPKGCQPRLSKILAYGEATGHAHTLQGNVQELVEDEKNIYCFGEDLKVIHEEHDLMALPKKEWIKVTQQREYDPLAKNRERKVVD